MKIFSNRKPEDFTMIEMLKNADHFKRVEAELRRRSEGYTAFCQEALDDLKNRLEDQARKALYPPFKEAEAESYTMSA